VFCLEQVIVQVVLDLAEDDLSSVRHNIQIVLDWRVAELLFSQEVDDRGDAAKRGHHFVVDSRWHQVENLVFLLKERVRPDLAHISTRQHKAFPWIVPQIVNVELNDWVLFGVAASCFLRLAGCNNSSYFILHLSILVLQQLIEWLVELGRTCVIVRSLEAHLFSTIIGQELKDGSLKNVDLIVLLVLHAHHLLSAFVTEQNFVITLLMADYHHWFRRSLDVLPQLFLLSLSHELFDYEPA